jgi:hypothetical protein
VKACPLAQVEETFLAMGTVSDSEEAKASVDLVDVEAETAAD